MIAVEVQDGHQRLVTGAVHGPDVQDRLPLLAAEPEAVLEHEHLHRTGHEDASAASAARTRAIRAAAAPQANRK